MKQLIQLSFVLLLASLVACGGGGGGGGDNPQPPANVAPTANAGTDFSAVENTPVSLDGSASSDSDGSIASYAWTQTGGSPTVTLSGADTAAPSFDAPTVDANTELTFELTVTDDDGASASDTLVVTITPDMAPTAVAPADFEAAENTTVNLDASASSDDVAISSYLWEQTAGPTVTINNPGSVTASFTAPSVGSAENIQLTFQVTVTDSVGQTATDSVMVTIIVPPPQVTLSGTITFDKVPHTASSGLDYDNTIQAPVRGALVELLNPSDDSILDSMATDAQGQYSFTVDSLNSYKIRVKAQLERRGNAPSWDFKVVDNTSNDALYSMDSAVIQVTTSDTVANLNADSGWTGTSYGNPRVAAPFAILDGMYQALQKVLSVDPTADLPALNMYWSINNVASGGGGCSAYDSGQIGTSHYTTNADCPGIYILGAEDSDTDEYDDHVIIHEWGHYFEDKFSRSDSIGGAHSGGDKLDPRVAMGEGWGNALSGIVTDDPVYQDSNGTRQAGGFDIDVESDSSSSVGWFSETSAQKLIYDLYDANSDSNDTLSLGFAPIYNAMLKGEKNTEAFTTLYTFAQAVKDESPSDATAITTMFAGESVLANDVWGSGETNNGGKTQHLPVYQDITIGGGSVQVCSSGDNGQYNKLGVRKYLKLVVSTQGTYTLTATGTNSGDDPDVIIYQAGQVVHRSEVNGNENSNVSLPAGTYLLDAYDYNNIEGTAKNTCIDIAIN